MKKSIVLLATHSLFYTKFLTFLVYSAYVLKVIYYLNLRFKIKICCLKLNTIL